MEGTLGRVEIGEMVKVQVRKVLVTLAEETHSICKGVWRLDRYVTELVFTLLFSGVAGRAVFMGM